MINSSDIKSVANNINTVDGVLSTKEATKAVLSSYDSIFEKRVQAILFISEIEWINLENQNQLSESTYIRSPRGVYSKNINNIMDSFDNIYKRIAYDKGFRTEKFYCKNIGKTNINDQCSDIKDKALDLIQDVHDETIDISDDELMKYCINTKYSSELSTGERIRLL